MMHLDDIYSLQTPSNSSQLLLSSLTTCLQLLLDPTTIPTTLHDFFFFSFLNNPLSSISASHMCMGVGPPMKPQAT